jgi:transcriptional regulator with XRE-family HTH domain
LVDQIAVSGENVLHTDESLADLAGMDATQQADDKREIRVKLGERLKRERMKSGLNQADFAAQGAVSKASQVAYESGVNSPDAVYLARLAANVDLLYVLTGVPFEVHSGRGLNWDLMGRLAVLIEDCEAQRGIKLPALVSIRFLRILYAASIASGKVDRGVLEAVFQASD